MNEEGGIAPEEFLNEYASDRAETTAAVWLAQTFNCNRCHDHKYGLVKTSEELGSLNNLIRNVGSHSGERRLILFGSSCLFASFADEPRR